MALKALFADEENNVHLILGLTREALDTIQRGEVYVLPAGKGVPLGENSRIIILFEETDEELGQRIIQHLPNISDEPM